MRFPAPKELPLRPFARLPDRLRNLRRSSWADANRAGAPIDSFLEGPCFDRARRFLVTDIPNGRILLVGPGDAWEVLAEYDGWPNGLALGAADCRSSPWLADAGPCARFHHPVIGNRGK